MHSEQSNKSARVLRRLMFAVFFNAALFSLAACGAALTQADQQAITDDAAKIAACQAKGLACQNAAPDSSAATGQPDHDCYAVYASCMQDAGMQ